MRGTFIRRWDKDNQIDTGDRFFSYGQGLIKNNLGSCQLDEFLAHDHAVANGKFMCSSTPSHGSVSVTIME